MLISSFEGIQFPCAFHVFVSLSHRGKVCYHESQQHKAILSGSLYTDSPDAFALFVYLGHYEAALT